MCAFYAQQSLNNIYLKKYNVNLLVKWIPREQQQSAQGRQGGNGTTSERPRPETEAKPQKEEQKENSTFNS